MRLGSTHGIGIMQTVSMYELGIATKQINKAVLNIMRILQTHNHEAYLVGGAVRDLLLGYAPKDFDVTTSARPEQVRKLFRRSWIIGRRFRLVHVRIGKELIEVSTFRSIPSQKSKAPSGQLLEDNNYGSAQEDAQRRDLTINALLLEPNKGIIYDYVNGIADIKTRTLRVIGSPTLRYQEDPIRMLRILRLASKLQCKVAKSSLNPIATCAHLLQDIVPSRMLEEISKLIYSGSAQIGFDLFRNNSLLKPLTPHALDYTKQQWEFCSLALYNIDKLAHSNKRISLSLALSALFWPTVSAQWQEISSASSRSNISKMRSLYETSGVLDNKMLTRIIKTHIWEIWEYQARFHGLYKKRKALSIRFNHTAEKSLFFLRQRHNCAEVNDEFIQWWETFLPAEQKQREAMLPSKHAPRKKINKPNNA